MNSELKFKRILFKVSGEAMMGDQQFGHDIKAIQKICQQVICHSSVLELLSLERLS